MGPWVHTFLLLAERNECALLVLLREARGVYCLHSRTEAHHPHPQADPHTHSLSRTYSTFPRRDCFLGSWARSGTLKSSFAALPSSHGSRETGGVCHSPRPFPGLITRVLCQTQSDIFSKMATSHQSQSRAHSWATREQRKRHPRCEL